MFVVGYTAISFSLVMSFFESSDLQIYVIREGFDLSSF